MSEEESIFGLRAACKASMVVMAVILTHPEWVQTNVSGEAEAIIRRELQIWGDLKESNKRSRK